MHRRVLCAERCPARHRPEHWPVLLPVTLLGMPLLLTGSALPRHTRLPVMVLPSTSGPASGVDGGVGPVLLLNDTDPM
jgi:hypothetical protein